MPHLTIEYTENLRDYFDPAAAVQHINTAVLADGEFEPEQVKTRALSLPFYRVGHADSGEAFVHVRIHVVHGRSLEVRQQLGKLALAAVQKALLPAPGLTVQLTAEVNEMQAETYQKIVISS
ncbi:hypothetical protein GCM10027046_37360 [Uliginosibacterium flavum]|uniref:5-carboxymethyl-2-hydroxymuconate Delta-isomerase n=1 Tax=Uliginosibacterium flavum TaxID=1396831 RepID=A0ABV2TM16_9RHOO